MNSLRQQELIIQRIIETGTSEELAILKRIENDPEVDPKIKDMIMIIRAYCGTRIPGPPQNSPIKQKKPNLNQLECEPGFDE